LNRSRRIHPGAGLVLALVLAFASARAAEGSAPAAPAVPIDVLLRLKGTDLEANAVVRNALARALEATRGTPPFLELVRGFNLTDQAPGLIELAVARADESAGAEALQRVLDDGGAEALRAALAGPNGSALVRALGNVADAAVPELLEPVALDAKAPEALRLDAVRALAHSEAGARALLVLARAGNFPEALKPAAGAALASAPWPDLKDEAARLLPPATPAGASIPPLAAALALRGDAARGEQVFFGAAACGTCHQLAGRGVDFGPGLAEIGDKFGKDALYANIVDPSAGIAFGYEPWQITLRNGAALGFIASETDDELTVKAPGNIVTRYRKSDVVARTRIPGSIMPPGLLAATSTQDVADLLEFLSALKKPR
jgi:putative heme-binding domain-containing protein